MNFAAFRKSASAGLAAIVLMGGSAALVPTQAQAGNEAGAFVGGLIAGGLIGSTYRPSYSYPAYSYPAYRYPTYSYPTYRSGSYRPHRHDWKRHSYPRYPVYQRCYWTKQQVWDPYYGGYTVRSVKVCR